MHLWGFISIIVYLFRPASTYKYPWIEEYHYPGFYTSTLSPISNGTTKISDTADTPDFRLEEPDFVIYNHYYAMQLERPYRNSPPYKQAYKISRGGYWRRIEMSMGCYCCAVYRRHIVLSTCAVITTRHILTTATPTALILRSYSHLSDLENILGAWYDTNLNYFNASMYMTPARIHIHPDYAYDYQVNMSHPIPCMYDLAIWASTFTFYSGYMSQVIICERAGSGWKQFSHTIPGVNDISVVAGFMFMKSYHRRPMPWFRYIVKTKSHVWPCPKSDWHWFHCILGEYWGRYGFDSGGGMNSAYRGVDWRNDGLAGICAFSMKLRSMQTTHYFTVVDTYPVLNFMYDAFLGLTPPVYLDYRFEDSKWAAPVPYWGENIYYNYEIGEELYYQSGYQPKYRR